MKSPWSRTRKNFAEISKNLASYRYLKIIIQHEIIMQLKLVARMSKLLQDCYKLLEIREKLWKFRIRHLWQPCFWSIAHRAWDACKIILMVQQNYVQI